MTPLHRAMTFRYNGLAGAISHEVGICVPFISPTLPIIKTYIGIWDTGATNCAITKKVVDELKLQPISIAQVNTGNGTTNASVYLIDLFLPDDVHITGVRATELNLKGTDVLIGMDIISLGDFSITNHGNKTTMSYRIPSAEEVDYVRDVQISRLPRADRRRLQKQSKYKV